MKDSRAMSSVQALDDYFDALLEEDYSTDQNTDVSALTAEESYRLNPQPVVLAPINKFSGETLTKDKRDLSSVEKLLSQLKLDEEMEVQLEEETAVAVETETQLESLTETAEAVETEVEEKTEVIESVQVSEQTVVETVVETEVDAFVEATTDVDLVTETQVDVETQAFVEPEVEAETFVADDVADVADVETASDEQLALDAEQDAEQPWKNIMPDGAFQVLFFESFGVIYAVPLAELGGIHRLEDCNHLIGRPDWYLGLQTERDQQLDVVDTAKWVMPEKIADNTHRDDYSYIVILGDSKWGMACNALLGTESLRGEQVRWREQAGKRPWLAGMVKEKMCALIHVEALIAMLNQGIDANALA